MSLKKLKAGSGYEYLTDQVAAYDSTELGRTPLADYYAAKGESPGVWIGSGLVGVKDIEHGDVVTAAQMKHLFGEGCDPVTGTALGRGFREGSVAGFDLTFSPAKSVSTLWAIAPPEVAQQIRAAHDAAVEDALSFLETHAIFTREGTGGARQVETRGVIATAFTHRDSRAGDPDLHTHVAVSNKVQTRQSKWLSIYGSVLYHHIVAASEDYNTALEHHLRHRLGLRFLDVPRADGKRPVREVDGVDPALIGLWSRRRGDIEDRLAELKAEFNERHGRAPTSKESIKLAQRANLETRAAKHEPRSEAEQRATWRAQAVQELGPIGVDRMIRATLDAPTGWLRRPDAAWLDEAANRVVAELESHRATWQSWHVYAEAQRHVRDVGVAHSQLHEVVEQLVCSVNERTINISPDVDPISEPLTLRRSDGTSAFRHTGVDRFTSQAILAAEDRILTAACHEVELGVDVVDVELAIMGAEAKSGIQLNHGQSKLVTAIATDRHQVALALAPAGSGKTTATRALADAWSSLGYDIVGLAPSAAAAAVLREATGMPTETLAKLDDLITRDQIPQVIRPGTMVVIDEAGMADTPMLDRVIAYCAERGGRVRLIGDDQQLAAVGAGGVLRDIATTHGAHRLEEVVRFSDPVEAQATLDLRDGHTAALGFYLDHDRIHTSDELTSLVDILTAWQDEQAAGRECLMLAPTRELVARLNRAARNTRLNGVVPSREVELADGNRASAGDTVLTRHNNRRLAVSGTDWVKNGDRWRITEVRPDGSLQVRHTTSRLKVVLPTEYVTAHVELGYATTVHAAQGQTADVMHGILTGTEDRQLVYTMLTRGRAENHIHFISETTETTDEEQFLPGIEEQLTAIEALDRIITRDGAALSATSELAHHAKPATQLHDAVQRYADAVTFAATKTLGADADGALEAAGSGPLPWLPGIPANLHDDPYWSTYLAARAKRVTDLAQQVRESGRQPVVLDRRGEGLTKQLCDDILIWRAANGVPDEDRRLLGPRPHVLGAERYARHLRRQVDALTPPAIRRWEARIAQLLPQSEARDNSTRDLAVELDRLQRSGLNADQLLRRAATMRTPLPADHTLDALAYRIRLMAQQDRQLSGTRPPAPATGRHGPSLGM